VNLGVLCMADTFVIITMVIMFGSMFAMLAIYASRYRKVPPDKAMVIYGRRMNPRTRIGYQVITGGGKFLLPIIEDLKYMDLGLKEVILELDNVRTDPTKGSSPVRINITVLYRISDRPSVLHIACEHLLDKTDEDIRRIVEVNVEGHARGIAATMTPKDIDMDRDEVENKLRSSTWIELLNMGIEIRALAIIRVHQKGGS